MRMKVRNEKWEMRNEKGEMRKEKWEQSYKLTKKDFFNELSS